MMLARFGRFSTHAQYLSQMVGLMARAFTVRIVIGVCGPK